VIGSRTARRSKIAFVIQGLNGWDRTNFPIPALMAISQTVAALMMTAFVGFVIAA
jgi:hypothetical protein